MRVTLLVLLFLSQIAVAQTLSPTDFEALREQPDQQAYLKKKGFIISRDSSTANFKLQEYKNVANGSQLQVMSRTNEDGSRSLELRFYVNSEQVFHAFVNRLKEAGYLYNKTTRLYDKYLGTYESQYVKEEDKQLFNGGSYYLITYVYRAGKELSVPVPGK